jgi:mannose-6-phosphate isomerase-like protein (cupin superfamily)
MTRKPFLKKIDEITLEAAHVSSGSRRLIVSKADDISRQLEAVTKGYLDPGAVFDWHQHIGIDEFWIVTQGSGFVEYKTGEHFDYGPGDFIYNPAELAHRIVATGDEQSQFFFVRLNC